MGKVILAGAGPGDKGLLTVKAAEYIKTADCIIYDRLIGIDILNTSKPGCELIYAGKENHRHTMPQTAINELLYRKALEYELVLRLKGGDPYVFGRGGEEALYLTEKGIPVEVIPGVSSCIAALTCSGIPVTHRGISRGFHVLTAHTKSDIMYNIDFSKLGTSSETCIFMMGLKHLDDIVNGLIDAGRNMHTPAAVISNGTAPDQRKCIGTLETISGLVKSSDITSPAIIAVGDVVSLTEELSFFEKRPLFGRTYLIPFIESGSFSFGKGWKSVKTSRLSEMLKEKGAGTINIAVGRIEPVKFDPETLFSLSEEDILVFTSRNAVHSFMWNLEQNETDLRSLRKCRTAAVGKKTAEELYSFGIRADIISEKGTAAGLGEKLIYAISASGRAVWFTSEETGSALEEALEGKCGLIKCVCYKNTVIRPQLSEHDKKRVLSADTVLFTSASNVSRTVDILGNELPVNIISIGPSCSRELIKKGFREFTEAGKPSYEEMIKVT